MGLNPKLLKFTTASPILLNVDLLGLTTGVGYKRFYAADVNSDVKDTVGEYILTTNQIYSSVGYTKTTGAGDYDFDIPITDTLRIGGECDINIPIKLFNTGTGSGEGTTTLTATTLTVTTLTLLMILIIIIMIV